MKIVELPELNVKYELQTITNKMASAFAVSMREIEKSGIKLEKGDVWVNQLYFDGVVKAAISSGIVVVDADSISPAVIHWLGGQIFEHYYEAVTVPKNS